MRIANIFALTLAGIFSLVIACDKPSRSGASAGGSLDTGSAGEPTLHDRAQGKLTVRANVYAKRAVNSELSAITFDPVQVYQATDKPFDAIRDSKVGEIVLSHNASGAVSGLSLALPVGKYRLVGMATRGGAALNARSEVVEVSSLTAVSTSLLYLSAGETADVLAPRILTLTADQPSEPGDETALNIGLEAAIPPGETASISKSVTCISFWTGRPVVPVLVAPPQQNEAAFTSDVTSFSWTVSLPADPVYCSFAFHLLSSSSGLADDATVEISPFSNLIPPTLNTGILVSGENLIDNAGVARARVAYNAALQVPFHFAVRIGNPFRLSDGSALDLKDAQLEVTGAQCPLSTAAKIGREGTGTISLLSAAAISWVLTPKSVDPLTVTSASSCIFSYSVTDSLNVQTTGSMTLPVSGAMSIVIPDRKITHQTCSGVRVSWTEATALDPRFANEPLWYRASAIPGQLSGSTVEDIKSARTANAKSVTNRWTKLTRDAFVRVPNGSYTIVVETCLTGGGDPTQDCNDGEETLAAYTPSETEFDSSVSTCKKLFVTNETYTGNLLSEALSIAADAGATLTNGLDGGAPLTGVDGADYICNFEKPITLASASVKAFIVDGKRRSICDLSSQWGACPPDIDWVLSPNEAYAMADGSYFGSTDRRGKFVDPLSGGSDAEKLNIWTGLLSPEGYWLPIDRNICGALPATLLCGGWTDDTQKASQGFFRNGSDSVELLLSDWTIGSCNTKAHLLCITQ